MNAAAAATFGCQASEVAVARAWLRAQIVELWAPVTSHDLEIAGDTELVISELVTNSINAGCGTVLVDLALDDASITLTVHDDASGTPALVTAATTATHGRGLSIVAALASQWGVREANPGKATWALLDR